MKYSYFVLLLALTTQVACASDDGASSTTESSNAGGTGSSSAGSSSTGGAGSNSVIPGGIPDPGAATALSQTECYVGLKVANVTYSGAACSASSTTSGVTAMGPKSWDDVRLSLEINLNSPPGIGKLDLASLTIRIPNADGTSSSFEAPVDACTATATDSAKDDFMGWIYYSIDISCTQPAMPTTDASLAPLPLNQFAIVTFFKA
ncbi:MAG TPA: hypothetical protein VIV60_14525 [Polyangiaceae bacterium]